MSKQVTMITLLLLLCCPAAAATIVPTASGAPALARQQQQPQQQQQPPAPRQTQLPPPRAANFDLAEYGVQFEPNPRLIVVMAALDAAGFNPLPAAPSVFRELIRKDQADLDPELRRRLQNFYERNKLKDPAATHADQAARYVSLAYALGPPPNFEAPPRTDDLPADLLEVLDFAPLVREFYQQSGIGERLPTYLRMYQEEAERVRRSVGEMLRTTLSYLHTRPQTSIIERVPTNDSSKKDGRNKRDASKTRPIILTREKQRRFLIVPDLLAVPGALNFRIIGDDYYAIVPYGIDPSSSELRRAYLQYLVDPLVARFNREIAARRVEIKGLLDERREKTDRNISPDVFLAVARSLVAAADVRMNETARLDALARRTSQQLQITRPEAERALLLKESQAARQAIEDAATAQLADAYERGAVLAFFFAEQLRGLETSGFDVANFFGDMMASFNPTREQTRPEDYSAARARFVAARAKARESSAGDGSSETPATAQRAALIERLTQVNDLLETKNYTEAETRLRAMLQEFQGEPRIFFALGQAASLSAQDAFDESLLKERLSRALALYGQTILAASPDADGAIISRAHAARGRILTFLERPDEAAKEFDAAIAIGDVKGGAYREALAGKQKLPPK